MWRGTSKVHLSKSLSSPCRKKLYPRWQSTSSTKSSGQGGKVVLSILGAAGLGIGGTIAYAKYDPKFRKSLEDTIPYADTVLKSIPDWGSSPSLPQKDQKPLSDKLKEKALETGLVKKQQERLARKEEQASPTSTPPDPPLSPPPVTDTPVVPHKPSSPVVKQEKKSPSTKEQDELKMRERLSQQEAKAEAQNVAIEKLLREGIDKAEKLTKDAVLMQQETVKSVKLHIEKLYKALDSTEEGGEDKVWKEANAASEARASATKKASHVASEAKAAIQNLKNTVEKGKDSVVTARNEVLLSAEEVISRVLYQLQSAETEVAEVLADAKIVDEYRDIIEKGKQQFQKELNTIMPDAKPGIKGHKLTEEELNFLIAHAHRRVEQLQKQLARQQVIEQRHVQDSLLKQKKEDERIADTRISLALSKQQKEMDIEFQKKVETLQEEFEHELRQQLRRQAAAHSDHIKDVLQVQQQDLEHQHDLHLQEALLEQKGVFNSDLSSSMVKLQGIENYLKAREELDRAARKSQEMWLACQAMKQTIKVGQSDGNSEPKPLSKEIAAVREAADENNPFVMAVLSSIPTEAVTRGVFTEESLKERFRNVDQTCCRVAMIDETGGSLYKYFLSYLQSFLIIDTVNIPKSELENKVRVDPKEWNTFDILSRARCCIQQDNLEQALRYVNQLHGEPHLVAQDWIKEVRLLLETRQAADALIAHAASVGVQAYH